MLKKFPFLSVRSISHDLHELNDIQMADRVIKSNELFEVLEKSKHQAYRNIITGDQQTIPINQYTTRND